MNEEMKDALDELFEHFQIDNEDGEWPSVAVWSSGKFHIGPISDELYAILTNLRELYLIAEEEPLDNED